MPKLLMLAYDFPPRGGSGVFRVTKFTRYLPLHGWQPVVIAAAGPGPFPDPHLLAELPADLEVTRLPAVGEVAIPIATPAPQTPTRKPPWRTQLRPWLIPEPQILAAPRILRAATTRLRQGDIAAIMSSGPPFTLHLVAMLLRRLLGIPWLMDMRDLWSEGPGQRDLRRYKLNRVLEQRCMAHADRVVVVSESIRQLTIRRIGADPVRIVTIPNGFDAADLPADLPEPASPLGRPFCMRYVGSVTDLRATAVQGLFAALRHLQAAGVGAETLRIEFIGAFGQQAHTWAAPLIASGMVVLRSFLPHTAALAQMASADMLILALTDDWEGRLMHTSKLFEYLAVGRPILVLGPEGEATREVVPTGIGLALAAGDVAGIAVTLRRLAARHRTGELHFARPTPAQLQRFERRNLTRELATQLNQICEEQHART